MSSAQAVAGRVKELHQRLSGLASLDPGEEVNGLFESLVRLTLLPDGPWVRGVMGDPEVRALRESLWRLCSAGECGLERLWSRRVSEPGADAGRVLREFPYYANYEKLTRIELSALSSVADRPLRRVLFIGSGPLPLSSVLMARDFGLLVDNVDRDEAAHELACRLAARLGLSERMGFRLADALELGALPEYDAVFLAALVGLGPARKAEVIQALGARMREDALLVVRGARGLKTLLYPPVDVEEVAPFRALLDIHPHNDVINSVLIAQRPGGRSPRRRVPFSTRRRGRRPAP